MIDTIETRRRAAAIVAALAAISITIVIASLIDAGFRTPLGA